MKLVGFVARVLVVDADFSRVEATLVPPAARRPLPQDLEHACGLVRTKRRGRGGERIEAAAEALPSFIKLGDCLGPAQTDIALDLLPEVFDLDPGLEADRLSRVALRKRMAGQIAQIFRGVAPGDIPIERPTVFEFAINLTIAKSLELIVPSALLTRADEVIE